MRDCVIPITSPDSLLVFKPSSQLPSRGELISHSSTWIRRSQSDAEVHNASNIRRRRISPAHKLAQHHLMDQLVQRPSKGCKIQWCGENKGHGCINRVLRGCLSYRRSRGALPGCETPSWGPPALMLSPWASLKQNIAQRKRWPCQHRYSGCLL